MSRYHVILQIVLNLSCFQIVFLITDCGRPMIQPLLDSEFKIYGGIEARPHSWPWQAYITTCPNSSSCKMCGGSLIANDKVITAAHCTAFGSYPASSFRIRLGTHDNGKPVGTENGDIQVGVKSYLTRSTDSTTFDNDVAILTLNTFVPYNDTISPVCLATVDPPAGSNCYATGWGYTETGWNDILKQVALPISNYADCLSEINGPVDGKLCAGAQGGKDTCNGDSGGPLVCMMDSAWQLVGVTSYGNAACGTEGRPGVYTQVTYYRDWIKNNT